MNTEKTILIMDDDPYASALLEGIVRRFGYLVECAINCDEAIGRLKQRRYDGVILDAWLEHEQGEKVLGWVRTEQRAEPIIMMSDTPNDELWVELIDKGAVDLIAKPVQPAQVKRTLQLAVEKHRLSTPTPFGSVVVPNP